MGWPCLSTRDGVTVLRVAVSPQARHAGADGLHDGALRVRLIAPPVDGKANEALLGWLADELRVPRRMLRLLRGQTARRKEIAIELPSEAVGRWLDGLPGLAPPAGLPRSDR